MRKILVYGAALIGSNVTHVLYLAGNGVTVMAQTDESRSLRKTGCESGTICSVGIPWTILRSLAV